MYQKSLSEENSLCHMWLRTGLSLGIELLPGAQGELSPFLAAVMFADGNDFSALRSHFQPIVHAGNIRHNIVVKSYFLFGIALPLPEGIGEGRPLRIPRTV